MSIKNRTTDAFRTLSHSDTLLINEAQDKRESLGQKVHKFGFGQSPFSPPEEAIEWVKSFANHHEYLPVAGLQSLREAVAVAHQSVRRDSITAEDIVIGPGSKIIIYAIMACFERATVLLPQPSWVSYAPQAQLCGHTVQWIPSSFEKKWKITPDSLSEACRSADPHTAKLLVLNDPSNPTGMSYSSQELQALSETARSHDIWIISDEIYGGLRHTEPHHSIATYYPDRTFITTGLSKWCGAGGWRVGVGIFPHELAPEFRRAYLGIASETYSTTAAPLQFAAEKIYQNMPKWAPFLNDQRRILTALSTQIVAQLKAAGVRVHQPDGGFYLFPDFSRFKDQFLAKDLLNSQSFCTDILQEASVAMLPGSAFGCSPNNWVTRLCYVDFDGSAARETLAGHTGPLDAEFCHQIAPSVMDGIRAIATYLKR